MKLSAGDLQDPLLALHVAAGAPQWLSTSRHVVQGGLELEDARWLEAGRTYSGVSTGPRGSAHDVFVFVPGDHAWTWERPSRVSSRADYSVRLVEANVARVRVRFDERERVAWKIVPDELAF